MPGVSSLGWSTAISNPCFEIWLFFHFADKIPDNATSPKELKRLLHELTPGGYKVEKFAAEIQVAATQAKNADPTPEHDYPDHASFRKWFELFLLNQLTILAIPHFRN